MKELSNDEVTNVAGGYLLLLTAIAVASVAAGYLIETVGDGGCDCGC